jgi:hypothetical protein
MLAEILHLKPPLPVCPHYTPVTRAVFSYVRYHILKLLKNHTLQRKFLSYPLSCLDALWQEAQFPSSEGEPCLPDKPFPVEHPSAVFSQPNSATAPFPRFLTFPPPFHTFALGPTLGKGLSSFLKTSLLPHSHMAP